MNYYILSKIGTGTDSDPFRPDIPDGVTYVCAETNEGNFLTLTPFDMPYPITDLQGACSYYGLNYSDVITWSVG